MLRTHTCGELTTENIDNTVTLTGWVRARRDHGGLVFIDLADRYGSTQVVTDPELSGEAHAVFESCRSEWVIAVTGTVRKRPEGQENEKIVSGSIEVLATKVQVFSESETPPFDIPGNAPVGEEARFSYRYLDLRRERMQKNMLLRHELLQATRQFFYGEGFVEIETPMLIKGTPEGSREYLVPSRVHAGKVYVLPQSPQQLKQLIQVAGFDRYMQIVRCFRDEDLRADRQPEFTQMDLEMSFCEEEDMLSLNERALKAIVKKLRPDAKMPEVFPRLTYHEAMDTYGSDKPDLRFDMKITDVSKEVAGCGFGIFSSAVEKGDVVKVLAAPKEAELARKDIDALTELAKANGIQGLAWIRVTESGFEGVPVDKLGEETTKLIAEKAGAKAGEVLLFAAAPWQNAATALGAVRSELGTRAGLKEENHFAFCWVKDFPLFEEDEQGNLAAMHHPFTQPKNVQDLEENPKKALATAYDVVCNGWEMGGGSMRIYSADIQKKIFTLLHISEKDQEERFGHLLKAFSYGVPPHGGIAWGLDRLAALIAGESSITEVIAFPKTRQATDLMLKSPNSADPTTLNELGISFTHPPQPQGQ